MANQFNGYKTSHGTTLKRIKCYTTNNTEDEAEYYEKELEKYIQKSLDSTERSRRDLENCEYIGVETAQDLLQQREKLENTENILDNLHHTFQHSQRNLNSLKSVLGGYVKKKFTKKPKNPAVQEPSVQENEDPSVTASKPANPLSSALASLSTGGYSGSFSGRADRTLCNSSRADIQGTRWAAMDNQVDENLDMMSLKLRNLRGLGEALGKEVEDQNTMLDRISDKTQGNTVTVVSQWKQLKKINGADEDSGESSSVMPSVDLGTKLSLAMKLGSIFK